MGEEDWGAMVEEDWGAMGEEDWGERERRKRRARQGGEGDKCARCAGRRRNRRCGVGTRICQLDLGDWPGPLCIRVRGGGYCLLKIPAALLNRLTGNVARGGGGYCV